MRAKQLAYAVGLIGIAGMASAQADDQATLPAKVEKIEVTGSGIKRIHKEGALPVTTLTMEDIKKTGATNVTDLIQMLPNMQGFTTLSDSINGFNVGETTAGLHALNQKYTLVLLNGRRFASWGTDGAFNLESIPLDAVDRVEVLSDGASALYGSDAIAGVVNFILKKNKTDGNVFLNYSNPQRAGGKAWDAGVSKGVGDLDSDGYNVLFTLSHNHQDAIGANQRAASSRGVYFPFNYNGQSLIYSNATTESSPANLEVDQYLYTPYYSSNGKCGNPVGVGVSAGTAPNGQALTTCLYNYGDSVEDIPRYDRDSAYLSGRLRLSDNLNLFAEFVNSRFKETPIYSAPAQDLLLTQSSFPTLWNSVVQPFLTTNGLNDSYAVANMRMVEAGGRADDYITNIQHNVFGLEGNAAGWDFTAYYTHSQNSVWDNAVGGYLDSNLFTQIVNAGGYNPFYPTPAQAAAIAPAVLHGTFTNTKNSMDVLSLHGSRELIDLPAGPLALGVGVDWTKSRYAYNPSAIEQGVNTFQPYYTDGILGGGGGQLPQATHRSNWGAYGELDIPLRSNLDVDLSARYDSYSRTHTDYTYDPSSGAFMGGADLGDTFNSTTYKATLRYTPVDDFLLRGSFGTGFRAPTMNDIASPLSYAGQTSGSYTCPFNTPGTCLTPYGTSNTSQYDTVTGGNPLSGQDGLKPEKSTQWTVGFRFEPVAGLSLGADLWGVNLKNQILSAGVPEQVGFGSPAQNASLFINPYVDPIGLYPTIAYLEVPINEAQGIYRGIDWDWSYKTDTALGTFSTSWTGTYMLKQQYQLQPGVWATDLGQFGPDQQVVFRTQMQLSASLQTDAWTHSVTLHYKSGYSDQPYCGTNIFVPSAGGVLNDYPWNYYYNPNNPDDPKNGTCTNAIALHVPVYATVDWQIQYEVNRNIEVLGGVRNVFDKAPPMSLQNAGGGNQGGYDGRYADIFGRTFYINASYAF